MTIIAQGKAVHGGIYAAMEIKAVGAHHYAAG
jgi:hypothetical protein